MHGVVMRLCLAHCLLQAARASSGSVMRHWAPVVPLGAGIRNTLSYNVLIHFNPVKPSLTRFYTLILREKPKSDWFPGILLWWFGAGQLCRGLRPCSHLCSALPFRALWWQQGCFSAGGGFPQQMAGLISPDLSTKP